MGNLFGKKSPPKPQANIVPVKRADTVVDATQNLARSPVYNSAVPRVIHALKHVRTRTQLSSVGGTIDGPQFSVSVMTVGTGDSKIHYIRVINRLSFCEVAQLYHCVNGNQRQFTFKCSLGYNEDRLLQLPNSCKLDFDKLFFIALDFSSNGKLLLETHFFEAPTVPPARNLTPAPIPPTKNDYTSFPTAQLGCQQSTILIKKGINRNDYRFTTELATTALKSFKPSESFRTFFNTDFHPFCAMNSQELRWLQRYGRIAHQEVTLTKSVYFDYFEFLLHLEECEIQRRFDVYNQEDVRFHIQNDLYTMAVNDCVRDYSILEEGTLVRAYEMTNSNVWFFGHVEIVHDKKISIKFHDEQRNTFRLAGIGGTSLFGVVFYNGRTTFQMEHLALEVLKNNQIGDILFPTAGVVRVPNSCVLKFTEIFNEKIKTNCEQYIAVRNIIGNTAHPLPYIIYGPPGTGKTTTMVEAILQIYAKQNGSILVAAATNSACDTITSYLLQYIDSGLLRLYGELVMRDIDCLNAKVRAVSNIQDGIHQFPGEKDLRRFRIIVATVGTCGRLLQANLEEDFFTHIFVDECGSVREPSAMIPICLGISKKSLKASIILAGDPKQLGPVIYSQLGESLGLDQSYLERLMNLKMYEKNTVTGSFDNTLITKLKKNYRSHPLLIDLSNRLFYDGEIEACGDKGIIYALQNRQCKILVNRSFPITFHKAFGHSGKDPNSTSMFNMVEVEKVTMYLERIIEVIAKHPDLRPLLRDIGIISPYRKQVARLKEACEKYKEALDIEIGSVEQFQGKEKAVIILSTVRSHTRTVGFLDSAKRFNVAMTRAKCLLITVGNPETLSLDSNWKKLVEFCEKNASIIPNGQQPVKNRRQHRR